MPRPCQAFVPVAATAGTGRGAQGWRSRKCAPPLGKPVLSTSRGALYYYDYVFIEDLRRRQGTSAARPGRPDTGPGGPRQCPSARLGGQEAREGAGKMKRAAAPQPRQNRATRGFPQALRRDCGRAGMYEAASVQPSARAGSPSPGSRGLDSASPLFPRKSRVTRLRQGAGRPPAGPQTAAG